MKEYKEARQKPASSKVDALFGKLNADLGLDAEGSAGPTTSAAKQISAAERRAVKDQLQQWQEEKAQKRRADSADQGQHEARIRQ